MFLIYNDLSCSMHEFVQYESLKLDVKICLISMVFYKKVQSKLA